MMTVDDNLSGFRAEKLKRVKISLLYRLSLVLVTVLMILLPLIYLGLIAAAEWAIARYAKSGLAVFGAVNGRGIILALIVFVRGGGADFLYDQTDLCAEGEGGVGASEGDFEYFNAGFEADYWDAVRGGNESAVFWGSFGA
jgi:hypothetical protein